MGSGAHVVRAQVIQRLEWVSVLICVGLFDGFVMVYFDGCTKQESKLKSFETVVKVSEFT